MIGGRYILTDVSYTHLDVYKRQPYASIPIKGTPISIGFIGLVDL